MINPFGPSIAGSIVAWRTSLERRFVFNPNQPINPADITAVKVAIATKRIDLEKQLRASLAQIEKSSNETLGLRNSLKSAAEQVWKAKQQQFDSSTLNEACYPTQIRVAALVGAVVASVVVQNAVLSNIPTSSADVPKTERVSVPPNSNGAGTKTANLGTAAEKATRPTPAQQPPQSIPEIKPEPAPPAATTSWPKVPPAQPLPPVANETQSASTSPTASLPTEAPPLPPAQTIPPPPGYLPPAGMDPERAPLGSDTFSPLTKETVSNPVPTSRTGFSAPSFAGRVGYRVT